MKNLYLLPSPNPSRLYYFGSSPELRLTKYPNLFRVFERSTQHIYITGDGIFKEGDWTIWKDQLFKVDSNNAYSYTNNVTLAYAIKHLKKVILTTESLDVVQAIPDEFLNWFVKNQNCKAVVVIEKSRCCGRCNGVDDLCFTDMCCDEHHVYGCETCYGKRVEYSITIPKDEIMERFIQNAKQEEPKESNQTTAIRFLEWYRRKRVIFQFHCYHIPNVNDNNWQETVFLGDNSYLNSHQLFEIFEKENYETSM